MYGVIAIVRAWKKDDTYCKMNSKPCTIVEARKFKAMINDGHNNPLIVDENKIEEAIIKNNEGLSHVQP